jgi:hypothetical protein
MIARFLKNLGLTIVVVAIGFFLIVLADANLRGIGAGMRATFGG